jgi:stage III sporulation protein SpoIIIAA
MLTRMIPFFVVVDLDSSRSTTGRFSDDVPYVAVDCEGLKDHLCLIQVGTKNCVYIFDCVKLGPREVGQVLVGLFTSKSILKVFHDAHQDAYALAKYGGIEQLVNILDTQLVMEEITGRTNVNLNAMLDHMKSKKNPLNDQMKSRMRDNASLFTSRPIPPDVIEYAAYDVWVLMEVKETLMEHLGEQFGGIQRASDLRATTSVMNEGRRLLSFDKSNQYRVASHELLAMLHPDSLLEYVPLQVSNDLTFLLDLLPCDLVADLPDQIDGLTEISIDLGRRPYAWIGGKRVYLGDSDRIIGKGEIESIEAGIGNFGPDNRAGIEKQLHRISAMREKKSGDIYGLTMRVGRHVTGNAAMMADLLLGNASVSILFLGGPGSGKTTVIREATRLIAEQVNTCIVDTSNEIAGDGIVPHPCVGLARRLMVRSLGDQANVMIECVQNHTPDVMVIDEIVRSAEVEAARTCKQRGVRMIASTHGDFRKLIKNNQLRGLIGGIDTVTLGDKEAQNEWITKQRHDGTDNDHHQRSSSSSLNKLKAQRCGEPVFDIIVELRKGMHHEWNIIMNVADAVDKVLEGYKYTCEVRERDPSSGQLYAKLEQL